MGPEQLLSGLRAVVGVSSYAAPNLSGKLFGLDTGGNPQASYMARLFGARDLALAAGTTATDGEAKKLWLQLGVACDVLDVGAGLIAGRTGTLPKHAAVMVTATAAVAAGLGLMAISTADA